MRPTSNASPIIASNSSMVMDIAMSTKPLLFRVTLYRTADQRLSFRSQQDRARNRQADRNPLGDRKRQTERESLLVKTLELDEKSRDRADQQVKPDNLPRRVRLAEAPVKEGKQKRFGRRFVQLRGMQRD